MQVDKGAIQFVLQGANIMCPGKISYFNIPLTLYIFIHTYLPRFNI